MIRKTPGTNPRRKQSERLSVMWSEILDLSFDLIERGILNDRCPGCDGLLHKDICGLDGLFYCGDCDEIYCIEGPIIVRRYKLLGFR